MPRGLVIPVIAPLMEVELPLGTRSQLAMLQELVGGNIEALPVPAQIDPAERTTVYLNEESKYECEPNMRATDFMVPGVGIAWRDYIAGPLVICGFDPIRGVNTDVSEAMIRRARLIADEAGEYRPLMLDGTVIGFSRRIEL